MKEDENTVQVQEINSEFYHAFENLYMIHIKSQILQYFHY